MNNYEDYYDPDGWTPPPWLRHDDLIAAVVGAWEMDERSRQAALLLARVHRCALHAMSRSWESGEVPILLPSTTAAMVRAKERGWLK